MRDRDRQTDRETDMHPIRVLWLGEWVVTLLICHPSFFRPPCFWGEIIYSYYWGLYVSDEFSEYGSFKTSLSVCPLWWLPSYWFPLWLQSIGFQDSHGAGERRKAVGQGIIQLAFLTETQSFSLDKCFHRLLPASG